MHRPLLEYFLSDRPEDIPDVPRLNQNIALPGDLSLYHPIDSLPNEILSRIFESGYFEGESFNLRFRAIIEQISRRWKEAAHHTPSLWSNYHLSQGNLGQFIDILPLFLKRSGGHFLDIHLNCFWDPSHTKEVMEQFLPHSRRWRSLSIITPGTDVFRYLHNIPAPHLETLHVRHFSSQQFLPMDPDLFDNHLPSLRHLTLRNVSLRATTLPLKSLHSLDIRGYGVWPGQEALEKLIGGSTELRQLTLHVRSETVLGDINPQGDQSIVLPSLRSLNIITSEGLSSHLATLSRLFSCPSLDTFSVKDSSISTTSPSQDMVHYSRTGSKTYPNSPSLRVKACSLYHAWRSLNFARKILTLELDDVRWPHWSNCMTVFTGLPLLQTMAISNVDTSTALSELGRPSFPLKMAPLKKLEIGFTGHKWDVVESDFAKFIGSFEIPQLQSLSIRGISWQQWKFLVLTFADKVKRYPMLGSLTLTDLRGLSHSLPDPFPAFPNLRDLALIRTTTEPLLRHLVSPRADSWPNLRSLAICGDPSADTSLLCRIITSHPKHPLSLILDTHFQSDSKSWNWLKEHVDVVLMPTVKLW